MNASGALDSERHGDENSIGASKFYRMSCFVELGGFVLAGYVGWNRWSQMPDAGWIACSWDDVELRFVHLRPMGSSQQSIFVGRKRHGYGQYYMGTGLLWMIATAVFRITERPYVVGGLFLKYYGVGSTHVVKGCHAMRNQDLESFYATTSGGPRNT